MANEQLEMDCYHKAEEGEPKFTLLARDPVAPSLVRLWAAIREGNHVEASAQFNQLSAICEDKYVCQLSDETKLVSACAIAGEMEQWAAK